MNPKETIVVSVGENICAADGEIASSRTCSVGNDQNWSVAKRTLHGGLQEGVQLLDVDNGQLKFTVAISRGMSIIEAIAGDLRLGWNSPVRQIVHPSFVDLNDNGGLGWLAGFNEMLVRCGVASAGHPGDDNGKMLTLHGKIGNIPASDVQVIVDPEPPHRIRVRGLVQEKTFKFGLFELWTEISTVPGSDSFSINDVLTNRSEYDQEYQIIYHANFGRPILEEGATFVASVNNVNPFDDYAARDINSFDSYSGPTKNFGEQVYCLKLNADAEGFSTVMLHNASANKAVTIKYDTRSLPAFTLWKNTDTETDGYVTGLEPGTGFPYNRSIERDAGRVPLLRAGDQVSFNLEFRALSDLATIAKTKSTIEQNKKH